MMTSTMRWQTCARAAVENGADAIYFGLERFNARMRAKNFTVADLPRLMELELLGYIQAPGGGRFIRSPERLLT